MYYMVTFSHLILQIDISISDVCNSGLSVATILVFGQYSRKSG